MPGSDVGRRELMRVYRRLLRRYGPAGWWPAETPFEVCVGAILVQNTAWTNAARAIEVLRRHALLEAPRLARLSPAQLAPLLRPAGTYNVKARRLAAFTAFIAGECGGDFEALRRQAPDELRARLLALDGIGPETADTILLYALGRPVFVVDAYTRRIFARLGWLAERASYEQAQAFFVARLPRDAPLFNDCHAQIVRLAKEACRARPRCALCPLDDLCPKRGVTPAENAAPARPRRGRRRVRT